VDFNEPLSLALERRVLSAILTICESYIERYPSTIEEDEALMGDRIAFALLTRQQRMAVKLRASEKRILVRTIKAVNEELVKLPSVMKNANEKIPIAGRSFDTLGSKATIQNVKKISDWVDIRDSKKESDDDNSSQVSTSSIAERRRRRREGK
jgi:hypothetical protein